MTDHIKSTNHIDRRIGERIHLRRIALGLSQGELAAALGLTFQQIQKYEKGANRVSASRLEVIARVLQVPVAFFYEESVQDLPPLSDTSQSLVLLRAFTAITHPVLQKQALAFVKAMAAMKL